MKIRFCALLLLTTCVFMGRASAQTNRLKPGFDKAEAVEMLKMAGAFVDTFTVGNPTRCKRVYRSPVVGLDNVWDLWQRDDGVGVISLRVRR